MGYMGSRFTTFQQYCIVVADVTARVCQLQQKKCSSCMLLPFRFRRTSLSIKQLLYRLASFLLLLPCMRSILKDWPTLHHGKRVARTSMPDSQSSSWVVHHLLDSMVCGHSISLFGQMFTKFTAIQLARLSGFSPIITTASLHNSELLSSLGATNVLDRKLSTAALKEAIANITSTPITLAFDAISLPDTQETAHDILTAGGTLMTATEPMVANKSDDKVIRFARGWFHPPQNREMGKRFLPVLTQWLADGTIKVCRTSIHGVLDIHLYLHVSRPPLKSFQEASMVSPLVCKD